MKKKKSSGIIKFEGVEKHEEIRLINEEGYGFILALKDLRKHYQHRRFLRASNKCLKKGKFVNLLCEHIHGNKLIIK